MQTAVGSLSQGYYLVNAMSRAGVLSGSVNWRFEEAYFAFSKYQILSALNESQLYPFHDWFLVRKLMRNKRRITASVRNSKLQSPM